MTVERAKLATYEQARCKVLELARDAGDEKVPVENCPGRVMCEPIVAAHDMPPFDNSAVDGYAVHELDLPRLLERSFPVVGEIAAGQTVSETLPGVAYRIYTGAMVPTGCGAVVMQEDAIRRGETVSFFDPATLGENIRRRGEEARMGDTLAGSGLCSPATTGLLAAAGHAMVTVKRTPTVKLVTTGSEAVQAGQHLGPGEITNSNAPALLAAFKALGVTKVCHAHARDSTEELISAIGCLEGVDMLVTTGGVSVGDHDLVRSVFAGLACETVFWRAAIKPGKPIFVGRLGGTTVFGLPGNPVSALVTFLLFVRPFVLKGLGLPVEEPVCNVPLLRPIQKRKGRTEFVPCRLGPKGADPEPGRASHKTSLLAASDGLVVLGSDREVWKAGDLVPVVPVRWGLER